MAKRDVRQIEGWRVDFVNPVDRTTVQPRFFRPLGDADPRRRCATCRHSIGWDSVHVFCQRAAIVAVYPCGHWEREAGSD